MKIKVLTLSLVFAIGSLVAINAQEPVKAKATKAETATCKKEKAAEHKQCTTAKAESKDCCAKAAEHKECTVKAEGKTCCTKAVEEKECKAANAKNCKKAKTAKVAKKK